MQYATPNQVTYIYENTLRIPDYEAVRKLTVADASRLIREIIKIYKTHEGDVLTRNRALMNLGNTIQS